MAKNKIITSNGSVTFIWGDESGRKITVNPNFVYVSIFEDTISFTLVGIPRPTGLSLFTTRYQDLELNGATFGSAEEALVAIQDAFAKAGGTVAFEIVDELPASGNGNTFYLLRIQNPELGNAFEEYIWVDDAWELVGSMGGSSIREIYVGTSGDSVDRDNCVVNKLEGKKDWLNIVYKDDQGFCTMTQVSLNEFILENEFESGVTVNSEGTVYGVVDPRQPFVHTEYDESGNPISSGDVKVLSVGESGFTASKIQEAIDSKVDIIHRLYDAKNGSYEASSHTITYQSDLNDELFDVELEFDDKLDSGSTNAVENSAITKVFEDVQDNIISSTTYVASSHTIEYNNRKDVKLFETVLDVDNDLDSGSTNPVANSAITSVIEDLEERKADWVSAVTSGDISGNTIEFYNRSGDTLFDIELPEGKVYDAGRAIKITSGTSADTISFDLPIYSGSGGNAIVMNGSDNAASGFRSIAGGASSVASNEYSVAIGFGTTASGKRSAAFGTDTLAQNKYEFACGNKNKSYTGDARTATIFTVGNGVHDGQTNPHHNALEIKQNGDIYIVDTSTYRPLPDNYKFLPMIKLQDALGGDSVKGDENTIYTEINADDEKVVSSLVYVKKITSGLPETVKERYQLVGADGNPYTTASGDTSANIDIYKDSHIVSITYITGTTDPHYQNLEYKYIDVSGQTQTTYVDISEVIIEAEVGDGLEVDSHIIKGKIDAASEKVVTEYTSAGTSAQTEEVLTVGENGFKASNIQKAIDAKHANTIKLNGFTSGATEDLFAITSADTVTQAFMKIENKLYKDDNNGLIFEEGSDDTVILDGGTY